RNTSRTCSRRRTRAAAANLSAKSSSRTTNLGCATTSAGRVPAGRHAAVQCRGPDAERSAGPCTALVDRPAPVASPATVQFRWPVGDVVTAIAHSGMRVERLEGGCDTGRERRLAPEVIVRLRRLPTGYRLLARRD